MIVRPSLFPGLLTESAPEHWSSGTPKRGDHIRVARELYNHHGIYVSDAEVIHYTSVGDDDILGADNEVRRTDLATFLRGGWVQFRVYTDEELPDLFPVAEIVGWARACLGDKGYNLFSNNCEHFANYCTLGRHHSRQVNQLIKGGDMGFLSNLWGGVKSFFGGDGSSSSRDSSSTTTTYEPDKVRVAEIEADAKIRLAGMEQERMKLYVEGQKDLLEFNAQMEEAVIKARVKGDHARLTMLLEFVKEANVLAEQRLRLVETCSFEIIRQIDEYYSQMIAGLNRDRFQGAKERIPELLGILGQYEPGSAEHELYRKEIEQYLQWEGTHVIESIRSLKERQTLVLTSHLAAKEQINSHINALVEKRMAAPGASTDAAQTPSLPASPQPNGLGAPPKMLNE